MAKKKSGLKKRAAARQWTAQHSAFPHATLSPGVSPSDDIQTWATNSAETSADSAFPPFLPVAVTPSPPAMDHRPLPHRPAPMAAISHQPSGVRDGRLAMPSSVASASTHASQILAFREPYPQFFLARPATARHTASGTVPVLGALVPLIPLDQLPTWLDIVGVPRELSVEQTRGMENLGEMPKTDALYEVRLHRDVRLAENPPQPPPPPTRVSAAAAAAAPSAGPQYPRGEWERGGQMISGSNPRLPQAPAASRHTATGPAASSDQGGGDGASGTVFRRVLELPQHQQPQRHSQYSQHQQHPEHLQRFEPQSHQPEPREPPRKPRMEAADERSTKATAYAQHHAPGPLATPTAAPNIKSGGSSGPKGASPGPTESISSLWSSRSISSSNHSTPPHLGRAPGPGESAHAMPKKSTTTATAAVPNPYAAVPPSTLSSSYDPKAPQKHHHQQQQRPKQLPKAQPQPHPPQTASGGDGGGRRICRFWCAHGWCAYGEKCRHEHTMPRTAEGLSDVGLSGLPKWWRLMMQVARRRTHHDEAQAERLVRDMTVVDMGPTPGCAWRRRAKKGGGDSGATATAATGQQPTTPPMPSGWLMDADIADDDGGGDDAAGRMEWLELRHDGPGSARGQRDRDEEEAGSPRSAGAGRVRGGRGGLDGFLTIGG